MISVLIYMNTRPLLFVIASMMTDYFSSIRLPTFSYASLAHPIRPMCCPHAAHFIIGNSIPSCTTMNVLFLHAAHAENEICSCCVLSFLKARKTTLSFMSWPLLGITFWSSGAVEAALRRPAYRNVSLLGAIS